MGPQDILVGLQGALVATEEVIQVPREVLVIFQDASHGTLGTSSGVPRIWWSNAIVSKVRLLG